MRIRLLLAFVLLAMTCSAQQPSLTVVEVDPPDGQSLSGQDFVSIHVAYTAPQEVVIWARPSFHGAEVRKGISHPSPTYHTGSGEAFGWFQINVPSQVDAIRVQMVEANGRRVLAEIYHPVALTFTGAPGTSFERAAWAVQMSAAQQRYIRNQIGQSAQRPSSAGSAFFGLGLGLVVLGALIATFAWPAYKVYTWTGFWRGAAAIPLAVMAFVILRIVIDTQRDPTSHNLWPFEIVMFGAGSLVYMAALTLGRRVAQNQGWVQSD